MRSESLKSDAAPSLLPFDHEQKLEEAYAVLGVEEGAKEDEIQIKKAYRKLALVRVCVRASLRTSPSILSSWIHARRLSRTLAVCPTPQMMYN